MSCNKLTDARFGGHIASSGGGVGLGNAGVALGSGSWSRKLPGECKPARLDMRSCPKMMRLSKMAFLGSRGKVCVRLKVRGPFVLTVQRLDSTVLLLPVSFKQSPVEHTAKVTCGSESGTSVGNFALFIKVNKQGKHQRPPPTRTQANEIPAQIPTHC